MAFQIEQSASVSLEAVCSGILLPVVTNAVPEAVEYARPMGPAQLDKNTIMAILNRASEYVLQRAIG